MGSQVMDQPRYPLRFSWSDGDEDLVYDEASLLCDIEQFDSDDPDYDAVVTDALGRYVRLRMRPGTLMVLELASG
jgi:hypothetical protein